MLYTIQTTYDILITIHAHRIRMLYIRIEQQKDRPGSVSFRFRIGYDASFPESCRTEQNRFRSGAERSERTVSN